MKYPHHASGRARSYRSTYRCTSCRTSIHWDGTVKAYVSDEQLTETCAKSKEGHSC